jgi:radical SAM superfamily enzyme YgiQ (UPF0313 family)
MKMKVLLISQPNIYMQRPDFPPIGIAYLGAVAAGQGYETKLIDAGLVKIPPIVKSAKQFAPDFIGVTCWTIGRGKIWELCAFLRKELPNTFLAVGGPHATIFPQHIFQKTHASAVVVGEGEETFKELLNTLEGQGDLKSVRGLALRNENGTVYFTEPQNYIENLDLIPRPFYEGFKDFSFSNYLGLASLPRPTAPIISSRGCVFSCSYCSSVKFWGNRWRYRSAAKILEEINWLIATMGARSIYFFDDNLPVNRQRLLDICEGIIEKKMPIKWACCSHVKMIDKGLLEVMKKSGCVSIDFGVESGSDKILKSINKKQMRADIERAFVLVREAGIKPRAYLMVGNIGEDKTTIDQTVEMIGKIKPYSSIGATLLWLLPGTTVYEDAVRRGHIDDGFWTRSDDVPYNLQEYSYKELFGLRTRLMLGIAKKKGGILSIIRCYLKIIYYRFPQLSFFRSLVPGCFR